MGPCFSISSLLNWIKFGACLNWQKICAILIFEDLLKFCSFSINFILHAFFIYLNFKLLKWQIKLILVCIQFEFFYYVVLRFFDYRSGLSATTLYWIFLIDSFKKLLVSASCWSIGKFRYWKKSFQKISHA